MIMDDGMGLDRNGSVESSLSPSLEWNPAFSSYEDAGPVAPLLDFDMAHRKEWLNPGNGSSMIQYDEGRPSSAWSMPFDLYGGMASGSMD
jgi:hypothetical protein